MQRARINPSFGAATQPLSYLALVVCLAAVYDVAARFGLSWATIHENITVIWPPSGIVLAVFLRFGIRFWPGVFLGSLLANLATSAGYGTAAGIAAGDTLEGLAAAVLLGWTGFDPRMIRLPDVLRFVALGGVVATAIAATSGAAMLCLAQPALWPHYGPMWTAWWLGDGLSMIVLTPFLLAWTEARPVLPSWRTVGESMVIAAVIIAASVYAFTAQNGQATHSAVAYAAFPAVLFATVRFGARGATSSVLLATGLAIWALTARAAAGQAVPSDALAVLQVFTASLAVSALALAAALAEGETALVATRRSEMQAAKARTLLADAVDSLRDHFLLYDADDRLVMINKAARDWDPAFAAATVPGVHISEVARAAALKWPADHPDVPIEELVRRRMAQHRKYDTVVEQKFGDRWLRIREFPTSDGGVVLVRMDVTDQKLQEAALTETRNQLVNSIEALSDAFALYDTEDRLVLCNAKYKEVYAVSADLLVPGTPFETIIREGARRGQYADAIGRVDAFVAERMAAHRHPVGTIEQRLADGRWLRIAERRTPSGHTVGIRTDITELKAREAELIAARSEAISANRTKSEFLAMMSHELRTPLNVVIGFAEILKGQGPGLAQAKVADYADDIYEAGRYLLALLNDVLDLSKAEAGKMELQLGPVNVADVVDRSLRMISERAMQRQITLTARVEPGLPMLEADERKLMQILLNLLSNAVKFTPEGGRVTVTGAADGEDRLAVAVIDTGIGIAPENIEKALTPFGQVNNLLTRDQAGTGLGLPLAKRLAELHGGTLDVQSKLYAGTTVTLRFPVRHRKSAAVA